MMVIKIIYHITCRFNLNNFKAMMVLNVASLSSSGFGSTDSIHLQQAVVAFNSHVSLPNAISLHFALACSSPTQKVLSGMIEDPT